MTRSNRNRVKKYREDFRREEKTNVPGRRPGIPRNNLSSSD